MNWKPLLDSAVQYLVPAVIIPLFVRYVLPVLLPATQHAFDWIETKAKATGNAYVAGLLGRLTELAKAEVLAFENTFIEDLKEKVANGRIDPKDIPAVLKEEKEKFLQRLKDKASFQGLWQVVHTTVFDGNEPALLHWLDGTVEALVAQLPPSGLQTQKAPLVPSAVQLATNPQKAAA